VAIFKKCVCNADRISPGCAFPRNTDEPTQSAAQLSQWALGARFLWLVSGKPRGQSPPAANASAVRSTDPLAHDAAKAPITQSHAPRGARILWCGS
jgi:hypothetical protein